MVNNGVLSFLFQLSEAARGVREQTKQTEREAIPKFHIHQGKQKLQPRIYNSKLKQVGCIASFLLFLHYIIVYGLSVLRR